MREASHAQSQYNAVMMTYTLSAGFDWTDTPTGWAVYRVKVWQENTPRVDENDRTKTVMAPERAWSSPIWVEK
jgi:hypothetical protein